MSNPIAKLSKTVLVRFTESDYNRLLAQVRVTKKEQVEIIREATLDKVSGLELQQQQIELARLASAGIDLKALVDYAIGKKLAEEAQIALPGLFNARSGGRGK